MLNSSAALGKMLLKKNSQVTRAFNSLVGTSEAIRLLAKNNKSAAKRLECQTPAVTLQRE
jgi:hypothetical protein